MDLAHDQFFSLLLLVVVPVLVWLEHKLAERYGIIWAKLNQPALSIANGGILGVLYRSSFAFFNGHAAPPDVTVAISFVSGAFAGLAASGMRSFVKDLQDGSFMSKPPGQ